MMEVRKGLSSPTAVASQSGMNMTTVYPMEMAVVYICLPICIFGLIGNGMLLCGLFNRIKRTKFTVYLFNLAVADLLIIIYHIIMLVLFLKAMPTSSYFLFKIKLMHEIGFSVSLYLLTAISTERFLGLFFPLFYNRFRPLNFTTFVCIVLWGFASVMALVVNISCSVKSHSANQEAIFSCESARISYLIVNFVLLGSLMVCTAVGLIVRMRNLPAQTPIMRLDKTIVAAVTVFLVLAGTMKILEILGYWFAKLHKSKFRACFPLFESIQSSGKPFLYLFIGYSKNMNERDRFHIYLERAVMDERYTTEK